MIKEVSRQVDKKMKKARERHEAKQARLIFKRQQVEERQRARETQQQVEKARIIKKRAKVFACRRCSIKFLNNTKLH